MGTQGSKTPPPPSPFSYNPHWRWDHFFTVVIIGAAVHQPVITRFINSFRPSPDGALRLSARLSPRCCTVQLDDLRVRLELYDDGGNSASHGALQRSSLDARDGVMLTYDYTSSVSFELAKKLMMEIIALREAKDRKKQAPVSLLLVGVDGGSTQNRRVDFSAAKEFAEKVKVCLLEVDISSEENIELVYMTLVNKMVHSRAETGSL